MIGTDGCWRGSHAMFSPAFVKRIREATSQEELQEVADELADKIEDETCIAEMMEEFGNAVPHIRGTFPSYHNRF